MTTSIKQEPNQKSNQKRRNYRSSLYRFLLLGLSANVLVIVLVSKNVAQHPMTSLHWQEEEQSSSKRQLNYFMEGVSKESTDGAAIAKSRGNKITLKVQTVQNPQAAIAAASKMRSAGLQTSHSELPNIEQLKYAADEESINSFTFPTHGCLVNKVAKRVHCHFQNLRINTTKISAAQMGGEPLDTVMGHEESDEFLTYQKGAFSVPSPVDPQYPRGRHDFYYMDAVNEAMEYKAYENSNTTAKECDEVWEGLTLFITRYEYVNLYHTLTDWWNTYYSLPENHRMTEINSTAEKVNVVFLDAHPEGNLDPVWAHMFGNVTYARHLAADNTCFREARFVPAGYACPLFPRYRSDFVREHAGDFVTHVLNAFDLHHVRRVPGHVVVIERVPYIAHPRSKPHKTQRLLGNMRKLALDLPSMIPNVTVEVVTLVNDTMRDQIAAIRRADVLVANHGAGLSHLLFLDAGAHVVELSCRHGFFPELAKWREDLRHYCQEEVNGDITDRYWGKHVVSVVKKAILDN